MDLHVFFAAGALLISLICQPNAELPNPKTNSSINPKGQLIGVEGGRRLYLDCRGRGAPTVVFESIAGSPSLADLPAMRQVAKFSRACVYDRAGLGWSDPAPPGRSFEERASDLHLLLRRGGVVRPYVLVGSSFGGLLVRTYSRLYPEDVAGIVLVDAAEEGVWFPWMVATRADNVKILLGNAALAQSGAMRKSLEAQSTGQSPFEPDEQRSMIDLLSRPGHWRAAADEVAAFDRTPTEMRKTGAFGVFGNKPLVVLSHGRPFTGSMSALEKDWAGGQARLASLSSNSVLVVAERNGHTIGTENPSLVAAAVRTVVDAVRSGRQLDSAEVLALKSAAR